MDKLNREVLRFELKRDEGVRLKAYKDSLGFLSIGTGRNLDARRDGLFGPKGISAAETEDLKITRDSVIQKGITPAQNDILLDNDITNTLADLDRKLPWWRGLDEVRQRVLANMCFNLGITKLLGFTNTLKDIQAGRYASAADRMLDSLWARQVSARASRLAELMRLGPRQL